jgi:hypothetical protein
MTKPGNSIPVLITMGSLSFRCILSHQQRIKSCLYKMPVTRENVMNSPFLHNNYGDTIRKAPCFITSFIKEVPCL